MRFHSPLLILGLASCKEVSAPVPQVDETQLRVRVTASASTYRPLDPARARITNLSSVTVYENVCAGQIEGFGFVPGEWNGSYGSGRACVYSSRIPGRGFRAIAAGASVEDTLHINGEAYTGLWRFHFDIYDADGDLLPLEQRVSAPFEIVR
jgi:hypothetical protein